MERLFAGARPRAFFARVVCDRRVDERDEEDLDFVATVNVTLVDFEDRGPSFRAQSCSLRAQRGKLTRSLWEEAATRRLAGRDQLGVDRITGTITGRRRVAAAT